MTLGLADDPVAAKTKAIDNRASDILAPSPQLPMPLTELAQLSAIDRTQALQILAASFGERPAAITHTPDVCGGDACLAGTRIPVWLLFSLRRQGASDAELLQFYPHLSAADLLLAQAYAIAYPEEMEAALQRQAIADASDFSEEG